MKCCVCLEYKSIESFQVSSIKLINKKCKECTKTYKKNYYQKNKTHINEREKQKSKIRYQKKKLEILQKQKERNKRNTNQKKIYDQQYRKKNRTKINNYRKNRIKTDPIFKLRNNLCRQFYKAIRNEYTKGKMVTYLGCTIKEFKVYLELKFQPGMTWENWGIKGWHIDHIKPISSFNLNELDDLKICFHYTNLQPLWYYDNISKGNR